MNVKQIIQRNPDGTQKVMPIKDEIAREEATNANESILRTHITIEEAKINAIDYYTIIKNAYKQIENLSEESKIPMIVIQTINAILVVHEIREMTDYYILKAHEVQIVEPTEDDINRSLYCEIYTANINVDKTRSTLSTSSKILCYDEDTINKKLETLDINVTIPVTMEEIASNGAKWCENVGTVEEGNKIYNSIDSNGLPKNATIHFTVQLGDTPTIYKVRGIPYSDGQAYGYMFIFGGFIDSEIYIFIQGNMYVNGADDKIDSNILFKSNLTIG